MNKQPIPLGSLLDDMSEARASLFPDLVRYRPDGSRYIECMIGGCAREAVDPQLHCRGHFNAAKVAQQARLEALDRMTPDERKAARRRANIDSVAKRLAFDSGQPDNWQAFVRKATESVDRHAKGKLAKAAADEVY